MKKFLRIVGISFLFINCLSALYGGLSLIIYPSGETLELSTTLLEKSVFKSFFFPGLMLFLINGLLSLAICFALVINHKNQGPLLFMQGFLSSLFIIVEIGVIHSFNWLQLIFGGIAIILIVCGFGLLLVDKRTSSLPTTSTSSLPSTSITPQ